MAEPRPYPAHALELKACPNCGSTSRAAATTCRRCWSDLSSVPALEPHVARELVESESAAAQRTARRRRLVRLLVALAAVALAAGFAYVRFIYEPTLPPLPSPSERAVAAAGAGWAIERGDIAASGITEGAAALDGELVWRVALDAPVVGGVTSGGDVLYVPTEDASLTAFTAGDGQKLWRVPVPGQLDAPPTVAGDRLYVGLRDGRVAALDARSGDVLWSRATGNPITTAPVVVGGILWALSDAQVLAFDAEAGTPLWQHDFVSTWDPVGPVVVGDTVAVTTGQGVWLFDRANGQRTYSYGLRHVTHLAATGRSVVALSPERMLSLDVEARRPWWDGMRRWWGLLDLWGMAPEAPPPPRNWLAEAPRESYAPVMTPTQLIVAYGHGAGLVRGYALEDAGLQWEWHGDIVVDAPVLTSDGLLVPTRRALVLLDPRSGEELRRRELPELAISRLAVTAGGTYLVTESSELVALR